MQTLEYAESTSASAMPYRVAKIISAVRGSSSGMCLLDPMPDIRIVSSLALREGQSKPQVLQSASPRPIQNSADLVTSLHDRSGLTWEQLAKALGVSRRSLHMWAAGSKVTHAHRRVMERFEQLVDEIGLDPERTKLRLLEQRPGRGSLFDEFRLNRNGGKREINGPALDAFDML